MSDIIKELQKENAELRSACGEYFDYADCPVGDGYCYTRLHQILTDYLEEKITKEEAYNFMEKVDEVAYKRPSELGMFGRGDPRPPQGVE